MYECNIQETPVVHKVLTRYKWRFSSVPIDVEWGWDTE